MLVWAQWKDDWKWNIACHMFVFKNTLMAKGNINYVWYQINNSISTQTLIIDWSVAES